MACEQWGPKMGMIAAALALGMACGGADDDGGGAGEPDGGPGGSGVVEVTTYLGEVQGPLLFAAAQDGDGAWEVLESGDGVYSFDATSGRYGFAYYCDSSSFNYFFSTVAENDRVSRGCFGPGSSGPTVRVTVNGLADSEFAWMSFGHTLRQLTSGEPAVEVQNVPPDTHDLVITAIEGSGPATRILVERGIEVRDGEDLELTFDMADAVETTTHAFTRTGYVPLADYAAFLLTAGGAQGIMTLGTGGVDAYAGFPDAEPTDMYMAWVRTSSIPPGVPAGYRFFHQPEDLSFTAPEAFELADASAAATTPHVRVQASFAARQGGTYTLFFKQTAPPFHEMDVYLSAGRIAGPAPSFTWQQPDMSGVEGWDATWGFGTGVEVSLSAVEILGGFDPLLVLPQFPPSRPIAFIAELDGQEMTMAGATAAFVP